jgi:hypothetical protein
MDWIKETLNHKPETLEVFEKEILQRKNIKEVEVSDESGTRIGYECELRFVSLSEYVQIVQTEQQIAMAELAEMLIGGEM